MAGPKSKGLLLPLLTLMSYAVVSIGVVFLSKRLLLSQHPLLMSWLNQLIGLAALEMFLFFRYLYLSFYRNRSGQLKNKVPDLAATFSLSSPNCSHIVINPVIAVRLLPLTASFVLMLGTTNACLKYQGLSSYQVARSLTLPSNLVFSWLLLEDKTNIFFQSVMAVVIISIGFALASFDRFIFSPPGLFFGAVGSIAQAYHNVQIKKRLAVVNRDQFVMVYYNTILAIVLLFPMVCLTSGLDAIPTLSTSEGRWTWLCVVLSGVGAITVNLLSYLAIEYTSPLSYNVTGYIKGVIQTLWGIFIFKEPVSPVLLAGIVFTLMGSVHYVVATTRRRGWENKSHEK